MLGAYAVGKTSLVRRYVESLFDERYLITIGVKIDRKKVEVDGRAVQLILWDVAGAEDHFSVPSSYVRGASGILLVVDGTRGNTVEVGLDLIEQIGEDIGRLPFVVAVNKEDLVDEWEVEDSMLEPFRELGAPVVRSSALTGEGVEEAFAGLTRLLL